MACDDRTPYQINGVFGRMRVRSHAIHVKAWSKSCYLCCGKKYKQLWHTFEVLLESITILNSSLLIKSFTFFIIVPRGRLLIHHLRLFYIYRINFDLRMSRLAILKIYKQSVDVLKISRDLRDLLLNRLRN